MGLASGNVQLPGFQGMRRLPVSSDPVGCSNGGPRDPVARYPLNLERSSYRGGLSLCTLLGIIRRI